MGYSYPAQKRFYEKARQGATVLLIYSGAMRFTQLHENAGVKVDFCTRSPCTRTFSLNSHLNRPMAVADEETCHLLAGDSQVLAVSTEGEPILTSHQSGKGRLLVCNAPIDYQAIERTDVFTGKAIMPYYLVLAEAARTAGIVGAVRRGDCPLVGITEHPAGENRTIVMAVNYEPRPLHCPISLSGRLGRIWRGAVASDGIDLAPNEAALFEIIAP